MPYITKQRRLELDYMRDMPQTAGELNYMFTFLANAYVEDLLNYQRINDVVGALDGAKTEFNRRVVAPYEDKKIIENGDVYYEEGKKP